MATTKIWPIHAGSSIRLVLEYVENPDKTVGGGEWEYHLYTDGTRTYEQSELSDMTDVMEYAMNDGKTEERKYVSGVNVSVEHAREEMMATKLRYHKEDGIILWHGYQSFKPGEVTPEEAHRIGLELAGNLWGKDYEVIVCTHLDKEHIHNHFVINSVSFRTGRKLDAKWQDMARESDRLCALYGKSVITEPKFKGKHYAMRQAEKSGKPTWISIIREDVDDALLMSRTLGDFLHEMESRGYHIIPGRKYFTLKPPGKENHVKLERWLGEEYSLEGIEKRIDDNVRKGTVRILSERKIYYCRNRVPKPKQTISGFQALYFYYCYKLGVLPKRRANPANTHYLLREEITKLNKIVAATHFLAKNRISDIQELEYYMYSAKTTNAALKKQRQMIRNRIRHAGEDKMPSLKDEINVLNNRIKEVSKELELCRDIKERSSELARKAQIVRTREYENQKPERYNREKEE